MNLQFVSVKPTVILQLCTVKTNLKIIFIQFYSVSTVNLQYYFVNLKWPTVNTLYTLQNRCKFCQIFVKNYTTSFCKYTMHTVIYNAFTIKYTMAFQKLYNDFTIQHCKRIVKYTMILQ